MITTYFITVSLRRHFYFAHFTEFRLTRGLWDDVAGTTLQDRHGDESSPSKHNN